MSSEALTLEGQARIEESVQAALKRWPTPWRRYNGRIVALNGATVGHFAPKVAVHGSEQVAPGITAGVMNLADFNDTISKLVALGEIMERAFKFSDVARMERLERRHLAHINELTKLRNTHARLVEALRSFTDGLKTPDANQHCEAARRRLLDLCPEYRGFIATADALLAEIGGGK